MDRESAQRIIDESTETRRLLGPIISASASLGVARAALPTARDAVRAADRRIAELARSRPEAVEAVEAVKERVRIHTRDREDAAEDLREARLPPTVDGLVPVEDDAVLRARLDSVQAAISKAAIDPELHQEINRGRRTLSDLDALLDADITIRRIAEQFAATDGARHPVALTASIQAATDREASARGEDAKARNTAEALTREYRQRAEDRTSDRSSPDADGFPPADSVPTAADADQFAEQLDELAAGLSEAVRARERRAEEADKALQTAEHAVTLVDTAAGVLRHLAGPMDPGRRASDIGELVERIGAASSRLRVSNQALSDGARGQQQAGDSVRVQANGPQARKVEDANDQDPHVVDLIMRLRADEDLPVSAERIAGQLEQRATSLRDDLDGHDRHVRTCATMLLVQAAGAIQRLRAYQNQSRLPAGLGDWSDQRFVVIDHEPVPGDESVCVDRVARVVHALLAPGAGKSDAKAMLFAAVRALVDAPFRVRILKPHTDLIVDRVDVSELKNFSGGQRVTAGVLLYATMARVRAAGDATSIGWLWLDNPFGQASADQFVRTMRRAADQLGLQLLFTAAPKDKGALSMFDRTITLARRSRPSSGERVVVVEDGTRDIVDLVLVQRDVAAVLGE